MVEAISSDNLLRLPAEILRLIASYINLPDVLRLA